MSREAVKEKERSKENNRDKWVVVMYNDDYTTMDFVILVLVQVFNKSTSDAINLMLQIHHSVKQVVGMYPEKLANAKVKKTLEKAKEYGYDKFRVEVEKV